LLRIALKLMEEDVASGPGVVRHFLRAVRRPVVRKGLEASDSGAVRGRVYISCSVSFVATERERKKKGF
jgi:hypothetical protein